MAPNPIGISRSGSKFFLTASVINTPPMMNMTMFCQARLASPAKPELSKSFWRISILNLDGQDRFPG